MFLLENSPWRNSGAPVAADQPGTKGSSRSKGPDQATQNLERPARLADGDLVEAVSAAVLRELEGAAVSQTGGISLVNRGATTGMISPPPELILI